MLIWMTVSAFKLIQGKQEDGFGGKPLVTYFAASASSSVSEMLPMSVAGRNTRHLHPRGLGPFRNLTSELYWGDATPALSFVLLCRALFEVSLIKYKSPELNQHCGQMHRVSKKNKNKEDNLWRQQLVVAGSIQALRGGLALLSSTSGRRGQSRASCRTWAGRGSWWLSNMCLTRCWALLRKPRRHNVQVAVRMPM